MTCDMHLEPFRLDTIEEEEADGAEWVKEDVVLEAPEEFRETSVDLKSPRLVVDSTTRSDDLLRLKAGLERLVEEVRSGEASEAIKKALETASDDLQELKDTLREVQKKHQDAGRLREALEELLQPDTVPGAVNQHEDAGRLEEATDDSLLIDKDAQAFEARQDALMVTEALEALLRPKVAKLVPAKNDVVVRHDAGGLAEALKALLQLKCPSETAEHESQPPQNATVLKSHGSFKLKNSAGENGRSRDVLDLEELQKTLGKNHDTDKLIGGLKELLAPPDATSTKSDSVKPKNGRSGELEKALEALKALLLPEDAVVATTNDSLELVLAEEDSLDEEKLDEMLDKNQPTENESHTDFSLEEQLLPEEEQPHEEADCFGEVDSTALMHDFLVVEQAILQLETAEKEESLAPEEMTSFSLDAERLAVEGQHQDAAACFDENDASDTLQLKYMAEESAVDQVFEAANQRLFEDDQNHEAVTSFDEVDARPFKPSLSDLQCLGEDVKELKIQPQEKLFQQEDFTDAATPTSSFLELKRLVGEGLGEIKRPRLSDEIQNQDASPQDNIPTLKSNHFLDLERLVEEGVLPRSALAAGQHQEAVTSFDEVDARPFKASFSDLQCLAEEVEELKNQPKEKLLQPGSKQQDFTDAATPTSSFLELKRLVGEGLGETQSPRFIEGSRQQDGQVAPRSNHFLDLERLVEEGVLPWSALEAGHHQEAVTSSDKVSFSAVQCLAEDVEELKNQPKEKLLQPGSKQEEDFTDAATPTSSFLELKRLVGEGLGEVQSPRFIEGSQQQDSQAALRSNHFLDLERLVEEGVLPRSALKAGHHQEAVTSFDKVSFSDVQCLAEDVEELKNQPKEKLLQPGSKQQEDFTDAATPTSSFLELKRLVGEGLGEAQSPRFIEGSRQQDSQAAPSSNHFLDLERLVEEGVLPRSALAASQHQGAVTSSDKVSFSDVQSLAEDVEEHKNQPKEKLLQPGSKQQEDFTDAATPTSSFLELKRLVGEGLGEVQSPRFIEGSQQQDGQVASRNNHFLDLERLVEEGVLPRSALAASQHQEAVQAPAGGAIDAACTCDAGLGRRLAVAAAAALHASIGDAGVGVGTPARSAPDGSRVPAGCPLGWSFRGGRLVFDESQAEQQEAGGKAGQQKLLDANENHLLGRSRPHEEDEDEEESGTEIEIVELGDPDGYESGCVFDVRRVQAYQPGPGGRLVYDELGAMSVQRRANLELKSLLKKPGRARKPNQHRVVFNENRNEFFDADYIILIREDCDPDDDEDDEECTCGEHHHHRPPPPRIPCGEPGCSCAGDPPPPVEFVDAVTLSPPEGYKDMDLGQQQLLALQQMARRAAVCRDCSTRHTGSESDSHSEGEEGEGGLSTRQNHAEAAKTDQSQQTTPTTPPAIGAPGNRYGLGMPEERSISQSQAPANGGSPISGILKGGKLWKQQSSSDQTSPLVNGMGPKAEQVVQASETSAGSITSDEETGTPSTRRSVRFIEADGEEKRDTCDGAADRSDAAEIDLKKKPDACNNSISPDGQEITLTFRIGSLPIPNNSLKPNSALRQLFPCPDQPQPQVSEEGLKAFEDAKRAKLPQVIQSADLDESIRKTIERNALRRSLIRYEAKAKKTPPKADNSLSERIKQLTCDVDDPLEADEIPPRGSPTGEEARKSPETTPAIVLANNNHNNNNNHLNNNINHKTSFSPSSSSTNSSNSSVSSTYRKLTDLFGKREQRPQDPNENLVKPDLGNGDGHDFPDAKANEARKQFLSTLAPLTACVGGMAVTEDYHYKLAGERTSMASTVGTEYSLEDIEEVLKDEGEESKRVAPDVLAGTPSASESGDELAAFVQQDAGRIERLKKKYQSDPNEDDDEHDDYGFNRRPSVRGIKPRFGSTTEIIQEIQSQMRPVPSSQQARANHVSWPYYSETDPKQRPHQVPSHYQYIGSEYYARTEYIAETGTFPCQGHHAIPPIPPPALRIAPYPENSYRPAVGRTRNGRPESPPPMEMRNYHQTMYLIPYNHLGAYQQPPAPLSPSSQYGSECSYQQKKPPRYPEPLYSRPAGEEAHYTQLTMGQRQMIRVPYGQQIQLHLMTTTRSESPLPGQFATARATQTPAPAYYPTAKFRPSGPLWQSRVSRFQSDTDISNGYAIQAALPGAPGVAPPGQKDSLPGSPTKARLAAERGAPEGAASVTSQDSISLQTTGTMTSPTSPPAVATSAGTAPSSTTSAMAPRPLYYAMNV